MTDKNTFVAILAALQKRGGDMLVACLIFQRIIHLMTNKAKQELIESTELNSNDKCTEAQKLSFEYKIKLITLMALTNKYSLLAPLAHTREKKKENDQTAAEENEDDVAYDSDVSSNSDADEFVDEGTPESKAEEEKQPASFSKVLAQFSTLRTALLSLQSFKHLDYFCHYLFLKCKDPKIMSEHIAHRTNEVKPIGQLYFREQPNISNDVQFQHAF